MGTWRYSRGLDAFECSKQKEAGDSGSEDNDGFEHGVISPIVGQNSGDDIWDGCFFKGVFNIIRGYMGACR